VRLLECPLDLVGEGSDVVGISSAKRRTTSSGVMSTPLSKVEPSE
jgi:hypothetical protein